jgi:hypothetical protein
VIAKFLKRRAIIHSSRNNRCYLWPELLFIPRNPMRKKPRHHKSNDNEEQHDLLSSVHVTSLETKSVDGCETRQQCTPPSSLSEWIAVYPTASKLLAELECPFFLDLVAGTSQWRTLCQQSLDHWKQLGRPEVSWRDAVEWECVRLFCKRLAIPIPSQVQSP